MTEDGSDRRTDRLESSDGLFGLPFVDSADGDVDDTAWWKARRTKVSNPEDAEDSGVTWS